MSTAYHLAKRKAGRIMILEKGLVGDGSSSRAAGIITGHLWTEAGVLARKKSGIDFGAMDEHPSFLFIMTISPRDRTGPHVQFLSGISKILTCHLARERLLQAESADAMRAVLLEMA